MAGTSKRMAARKGSGAVKGVKILLALVAVLLLLLVILNFAHKPTFNLVANATGGWHDSLTHYFWGDVSRALVTEAKLSADEQKGAEATLTATTTALRSDKGSADDRAALAKAADALVGAWSKGKRSADDVRPLLKALDTAVAKVEGRAAAPEEPTQPEPPADEGTAPADEGTAPADEGEAPADPPGDGGSGDGESGGGGDGGEGNG